MANSFAAPFVSDRSTGYIEAADPARALDELRESYDHPCGLYVALIYASADDWHKDAGPLARWLSPKATQTAGDRSR